MFFLPALIPFLPQQPCSPLLFLPVCSEPAVTPQCGGSPGLAEQSLLRQARKQAGRGCPPRMWWGAHVQSPHHGLSSHHRAVLCPVHQLYSLPVSASTRPVLHRRVHCVFSGCRPPPPPAPTGTETVLSPRGEGPGLKKTLTPQVPGTSPRGRTETDGGHLERCGREGRWDDDFPGS